MKGGQTLLTFVFTFKPSNGCVFLIFNISKFEILRSTLKLFAVALSGIN